MTLAEELMSKVKSLAAKGYRHLDADEDVKAMKVLSALGGVRGCYLEIDEVYAKVGSGNPAASAERAQTTPQERSAIEPHQSASVPLRLEEATTVERYGLRFNGGMPKLFPLGTDDGDWVRYDDHKAALLAVSSPLKARIAELEAQVEGAALTEVDTERAIVPAPELSHDVPFDQWPTPEQLEWWANAARTAWGERDLAWHYLRERDALLGDIRARWYSSHELVTKINALIGCAPVSTERSESSGSLQSDSAEKLILELRSALAEAKGEIERLRRERDGALRFEDGPHTWYLDSLDELKCELLRMMQVNAENQRRANAADQRAEAADRALAALREQTDQDKALGGHESHGGRSDLGPAAPSTAPHDASAVSVPCSECANAAHCQKRGRCLVVDACPDMGSGPPEPAARPELSHDALCDWCENPRPCPNPDHAICKECGRRRDSIWHYFTEQPGPDDLGAHRFALMPLPAPPETP